MLGTVLRMDMSGNQSNRPKDKKFDYVHSKDNMDIFYVSRKEGGRGFASIEDGIDTSTTTLKRTKKDYLQQPITASAI